MHHAKHCHRSHPPEYHPQVPRPQVGQLVLVQVQHHLYVPAPTPVWHEGGHRVHPHLSASCEEPFTRISQNTSGCSPFRHQGQGQAQSAAPVCQAQIPPLLLPWLLLFVTAPRAFQREMSAQGSLQLAFVLIGNSRRVGTVIVKMHPLWAHAPPAQCHGESTGCSISAHQACHCCYTPLSSTQLQCSKATRCS